jgi:hypothetical protein
LSEGHRVGRLARERWPRGVLVEETSARHARAVARTRSLLDDTGVPAIFEAAFEHDGLRIRADVLVRDEDGSYELIEVKSSLAARPEHLLDLAVQAHVIDGSGIELSSASLLHLDPDYEWPGGRLDRERLFHRVNLTDQVLAVLPGVRARVVELREVAAADRAPEVEMSPHCLKPQECPFLVHCRREAGVATLPDVAPTLNREAEAATLPPLAAVLDVQTFSTALPSLPGTRPHEPIPFAWALSVPRGDAGAMNDAFHVADPSGDPRDGFLSGLDELIPEAGAIGFFPALVPRVFARLAERGDERAAVCVQRLVARGVDLEHALSSAAVNACPSDERPPFPSRRDAAAAYLATRETDLSDTRRRASLAALGAQGRWMARRLASKSGSP